MKMNKRNSIIGGGIIVIIIAVIIYFIARPAGGTLDAFTVDYPNFVAIGENLQRVEVIAITEATSTKSQNIRLGTMEIAEGSAEGLQTWTLEIPDTTIAAKEIYAQAYSIKGRKAGKIILPYTSAEEIKNALVGPSQSDAVLPGAVKDIAGRTITFITSGPFQATLTVTVTPDAKVVDSTGKPVNYSVVKKGTKINVIGDFTEETSFTATGIELVK